MSLKLEHSVERHTHSTQINRFLPADILSAPAIVRTQMVDEENESQLIYQHD